MRLAASIMIAAVLSFSAATARASSCGNQIAAFEKYLDAIDAFAPGSQTISGGARINKAKLILDDAKAEDERGDAKACGSSVKEAKQETGAQ
jgi:hypothetical protein